MDDSWCEQIKSIDIFIFDDEVATIGSESIGRSGQDGRRDLGELMEKKRDTLRAEDHLCPAFATFLSEHQMRRMIDD